jgi:alpha-beta hydrolase superfamily lysophospholipase
LGHGHTAADPSELGFVADRDGWQLWVADVRLFSDAVREEYGIHLPYILMGHSMGSFIARLAAVTCVSPHKLILMGTGGPNPVAGVGLAIINAIKSSKGPRHISPLVDDLAFGSYNKRFGAPKDSKVWLSKDSAVTDAYVKDPFCNYKFTVSGMSDLVRMTALSNKRFWFKSLDESIPVLLVSGKDDPVGDFGKGVETVFARLRKAGKQVTCRLYEGYRHEILNDACHDRVVKDILDFVNSTPSSRKETDTP